MKTRVPLFVALLLVTSVAYGQPFLTSKDLDLTTILPPPPLDNSAQTRAEIAELLSVQNGRTAEMAERAVADSEETVWRFAELFGPKFKKESLPLTSALFERLHETEGAVVDTAKEHYNRPRPYTLSDQVQPAAKQSKCPSYPSGHSTGGTLMGIVLANMVPERRREVMDRAWDYGENRIVGGVHYRSDVDAGHIAGSLIAERLFERADFRREFEAARKELRAVLDSAADSPVRP